eukprot:Seg3469.2 transcript_id=Seg3469.2/GoldUCD/mRNA.D3Y31 product="hypothetical protein" protein_id=Seg3469.2/GoldUCD/D3Y31
MEGNKDFSWPTPIDSTFFVAGANNLSSRQSPKQALSKDQLSRTHLPVRIQDGRIRTNMNLRKFFTRDGDVHGFIRRTRKSKKGFQCQNIFCNIHS